MKNIKNLPIIILDIILDIEKRMSKIEISIFKILKSKSEKLNNELTWITEVEFENSYLLWIAELKKSQNKSTFILYSQNLNKFSKEYEKIKIKKDEFGKKILAYPGGTLLPLEFKFSKKKNELDWIMKMYTPIKKQNFGKYTKKLPKNKKNWIRRAFSKIVFYNNIKN